MANVKQEVRDSFFAFGASRLEEPEINEVVDSLQSGWLATGPKVKRFEEAFCESIGAEHAF